MTTIRIEDYMARSAIEDLRERYEPKVKKLKEKMTSGKAVSIASIPVFGTFLADNVKANAYTGSSYFASPGYYGYTNGGFSNGEMIPVAGPLSDAVKERIISAFDPLVDLIIALSLPISGVMLAGGSLMILIGMKDMGFRLIMNAGLGYVLVQMSPLFIDLLAGIGSAI